MSTSYYISKTEAQQNTRRAVRDAVKRRARKDAALAIILSVTAATVGISYSNRGVQALEDQIVAHEQQLHDQAKRYDETISILTTENQELSAELSDAYSKLHDVEAKLSIFISDHEIKAAAPPSYDVPLSSELQEYTYNRCVDYGIAEYYDLVLAVMWQETNFVDNIISETDDYGIMQINKVNHGWLSEALGITDFLDAKQNIHAGVSMLAKLLNKYDVHEALMAYNMGEGGAQSFWDAGTYTSDYSRSVAAKREQLVLTGYNPN